MPTFLLSGYCYDSIGERLGITLHGAKKHIRNVFQKLNVQSHIELIKKFLAPKAGSV